MKYMCPSCGDVLNNKRELLEHWKKENYEEDEEFYDFKLYSRMARYEYLTHHGWKRKKRVACPFHAVCTSPSKDLNWACGEGDMEQRCITFHVLKNRLRKEERERLGV